MKKEPAMMPFAMDAGNSVCASRVKGACKVVNNTGGITNLVLKRPIVGQYDYSLLVYLCEDNGRERRTKDRPNGQGGFKKRKLTYRSIGI